ncbi:MAG: Lsr2 family protein [Actinomycetota bacterium]|nr:Lsr2 family protein [Actinomycetota bacterium]
MAQKVQILLVDDLDGSDASHTVEFALDGTSYEIDLSEANAAAMRDAFAVYVAEARKIGSRRGGRAKSRTTRSGGASDAAEVREWARANGYQVSDRGRVSAEVRAAYDAAH